MDALKFLGGALALLLCWWIYAHGLANVIEAFAIVLLKHARWLRRAHEQRQQVQAEQLRSLDSCAGQAGTPDIESEIREWERGHA
jgi:hypothetical protein